jgi:hypothetical protein
MYLHDIEKRELQETTLPEGYTIISIGPILPGDIRWNPWLDCWNLSEPVSSPKHDPIIGNPVTICHGICRYLAEQTELSENRIFKAHLIKSSQY